MHTSNVSAHWNGEGLEFVGADARGREITMGGYNIKPSQMLLMALAGCMGMDVLSILQKKKQKISDFDVQVTAEQPDDYPRPFQAISMHFVVKGEGIEAKAVQRAIDLSHDKYCVVGQSLNSNIEFKTSFAIEPA